jgi:hypothetical protein
MYQENGQVNGNLNSNNTVSGATVTSRSETYTQNWFRTLGDGGIYFQKYGGGWNMGDTATINAYGGKNVQTSAGHGGYIKSTGNIDANGRVNAGEFVYINGQANVGWGCSPNGLQEERQKGLFYLVLMVCGKVVLQELRELNF